MTVDERHYDITLRDARLPLVRDGWFLAAVTLFLSMLTTSAWQHNIVGVVLSPFAFVLIAWWRRDLTRVGAWRRKARTRARMWAPLVTAESRPYPPPRASVLGGSGGQRSPSLLV